MSGETLYQAPLRNNVSKMRVHDYLYDSTYIVSGARDYARTSFKAAMASAQVTRQPLYESMFSDLKPRMQAVYYPNCRLPDHMDRSYEAYLAKLDAKRRLPLPDLAGKDRFKYGALPKKVMSLASATPDFHPPTPVLPAGPTPPRTRGTQSIYRESSAQTIPWQPDGRTADGCENTPEVLYLDKLEWGPGSPYRLGDLPADFHTTEIINKMRHARKWMEIVEKGQFPRWMKKRDEIIADVEMKDWIFREAEIDELQDIRLSLLRKLQSQRRERQTNKTSKKLAKLWHCKKEQMERKIETIRKNRDRELRKLTALHEGGGKLGLVARKRAARAGGPIMFASGDPTSDIYAALTRHGYQARGRHAEICYDPGLLTYEDHMKIAEPPAWLEQCGQNLKKSCSGHHLPLNPTQPCERETKWSEQFLENLHNDLKKARLGAGTSAGPLRVLKPRHVHTVPRPATPVVDSVVEADEVYYQSALVLQRIIRGRAVQSLMYEGRTRAAELTEELKTTHGLQKEDKIRIAKEEAKAREYNALRSEGERKEAAISALVEELCGGAVSTALDFLEKELRRLRDERKQHAFILIAIREKMMREAAEAGRRQKEEQRRREHDEMFRQVVGVTQETVDAYLCDVVAEGAELAAEEEAVRRARAQADGFDVMANENSSVSTAEEHEMVAALVQQFLLPNAHKTAARMRLNALQDAKLAATRSEIFGILDEESKKPEEEDICVEKEPTASASRDDWRWKMARRRPMPEPKTYEERFPPSHTIRCMLNEMVDDVAAECRRRRSDAAAITTDYSKLLKERVELTLDAMAIANELVDRAMGVEMPGERPDYHYFMWMNITDALERSEPHYKPPCPKELPSEIRRRATEKAAEVDPTCYCEEKPVTTKGVKFGLDLNSMTPAEKQMLLPSKLRQLEAMRRCKCELEPTSAQKLNAVKFHHEIMEKVIEDSEHKDHDDHESQPTEDSHGEETTEEDDDD